MVTLGMRRLESAAAIAAALVLAVISSPLVAQSLSADDRELEQIQEILSRDGPYSLDLLGPLSRLGLIYQEGEDYALALVTLERAQHIVRVNNGLHSMDQVPLMRQLIAVEDARGNHEGAWDRQQDLLELLRRHPDDVRTVPVLRDIADDPLWFAGILLRRLGATVTQWKLWPWPPLDGRSIAAARSRNEGALDSYYALAAPVDRFGVGGAEIEVPIALLLAPTAALLAIAARERWRGRRAGDVEAGLLLLACLAAATIVHPVAITTARST